MKGEGVTVSCWMQNGDSEVVKSQQASAARRMAKPMLEVTAVGAIQLPDIEVMRGFGGALII